MRYQVHSRTVAWPHSKNAFYAAMRLCGYATLLFAAPAAFACPVCFGAAGPQQDGVNNAIFFMLAIVGVVQLGFAALFWTFWKRGRALRKHREEFRLIKGGVS